MRCGTAENRWSRPGVAGPASRSSDLGGSGERWRLLADGDLPGAVNMARDLALVELVSRGASPPTLRLYGWQPPCLSLGRHQEAVAADWERCRSLGVDMVRRPTGGRALLHHLELTYAVAAPLGLAPLPRALQDAYRLLCAGLVHACRALGVDAELCDGGGGRKLPGPESDEPCFRQPAAGEVVVAGRKLVGSASRAHHGALLQHGAILLDWDSALQASALGLPDDSSLRPFVTTFADHLGRIPEGAVLEAAIVAGFSAELGVTLQPGQLTSEELARAAVLETDPAIVVGGSQGEFREAKRAVHSQPIGREGELKADS